MASRFIKHDLEHITDYIEFESFCHDMMSREGYKDIQPLGGSKDKGRDAVHVSRPGDETTIFAYSVREDWEEKLFEDLNKLQGHGHQCDQVVYITTGKPTALKIDALVETVRVNYGWGLEMYDLERIGTLVENQYKDLMALHPSIFVFSLTLPESEPSDGQLDRILYAQYLLRAYEEWLERYTPLLAQHREFETLVIPSSSAEPSQGGILVTDMPEIVPIAIVLGESGAGKTTALWRIVVERSKNLIENNQSKIPILISLRSWSSEYKCRDLIQQAFALVGAGHDAVERELLSGNCLILMDGLNELSPSDASRTEAYKDIQRFLINYSQNQFVICCRGSDYGPRMLDLEQLKPKLPEANVFEIRRLDSEQVIDYVGRYFRDNPDIRDQLLADLEVNNETLWRDTRSLLNLVRIPLYLQLVIIEYERSKQLPDNRAKLLRTFFQVAAQRESVRHAARVDRFGKERLLGSLAYRAIQDGYSLRIPDHRAHSTIRNEMNRLKSESLIQQDLTFGAIWQEILSNNFLAVTEWGWIEWLHQLIRDYFLACEIVRIRTDGDASEVKELNRRIDREVWEEACAIAVGLLDPTYGARLLEDLARIDSRIARSAFVSLSAEDEKSFAESIVREITSEDDAGNERLNRIAISLPFLPLVQALGECFRSSSDPIRVGVAEAVSSVVIKHYAKVDTHGNEFGSPYRPWSVDETFSEERLLKAVKRGLQLLEAWIGNRNDEVRFYAAKGLWETDRSRASLTLKQIRLEGNPRLVAKVEDLMEDWGIT